MSGKILSCPIHKTVLAKIYDTNGTYNINLYCRKCKKEYIFHIINYKKVDNKTSNMIK